MPAIRSEKWIAVYDSIQKSFSGTWELVIITEKEVPAELCLKSNVNIIFSERSPLQKQQQALELTEGEWITVMSDDSLWHEGKLDEAFKLTKEADYKTIIVMKYLEGQEFPMGIMYVPHKKEHRDFKTNWDFMKSDAYYYLENHGTCQLSGMPSPAPVLSVVLMNRKLLLEVGGWDCTYQTQGIGNCDLGARLMHHGCKFIVADIVVSSCDYTHQAEGDHGAIHDAIVNDDIPLLQRHYGGEQRHDRIFFPLDNWKKTPEVWIKKRSVA